MTEQTPPATIHAEAETRCRVEHPLRWSSVLQARPCLACVQVAMRKLRGLDHNTSAALAAHKPQTPPATGLAEAVLALAEEWAQKGERLRPRDGEWSTQPHVPYLNHAKALRTAVADATPEAPAASDREAVEVVGVQPEAGGLLLGVGQPHMGQGDGLGGLWEMLRGILAARLAPQADDRADVRALREAADALAVDSSLTDGTRRDDQYADARDDERVDNVEWLRTRADALAERAE